MLGIFLVAAVLFLTYSNGANDNFKGVATLYGSGESSYLVSLRFAALTTFCGSIAAFFLASGLIKAFSGHGLVGAETAGDPAFILSVMVGAALTVFLATRLGLPISTTHSIIGGLIGAGFMSIGTGIDLSVLLDTFLKPLLISPFIAIAGAVIIYPLFSYMKKISGIKLDDCVCVSPGAETETIAGPDGAMSVAVAPAIEFGGKEHCQPLIESDFTGLTASSFLRYAHYLSAGAVSFARGLNDTPKILGLLVAGMALDLNYAILIIGVVMAAGGLISAKKVAETMSKRITPMSHGQGFSANLVTSCVVIGASLLGAPVSTTHVSVGSLFGIGMVKGTCRWGVLVKILISWIATLPMAIAISALTFMIVS